MRDPYAGVAVLDHEQHHAGGQTDPYAAFSRLADDVAEPTAAPPAADDEARATPARPKQQLPLDPLGQMDIGFANQSAADANSRPEGSDQYVREVTQGFADGTITSPADLNAIAAKYGYGSPDQGKLNELFAALKKGAKLGGVSPPEYAVNVSDHRGEGGIGETVKAAVRGVPAILGLDDEINAAIDVALNGEDWRPALAQERAIRDYDEDNHFWARLGGELVGGGGIDAAVARGAPALTARAFAKSAAIDALLGGSTRAEALAAGRRAFTVRGAQEGGVMGGVYGFAGSDGDLGDRVLGGVGGAAIGATSGGLLANMASRVAGRMAERARARAVAPLTDAQETFAAAQRQGVELLPQDVAGDGITRATQGAAQSTFGAPIVRRSTDRLFNSFKDRVDDIAGSVETAGDLGDVMRSRSARVAARDGERADFTSGAVERAVGVPSDMTGAGQVAQRGVARFMDETAERANVLYSRVPIEPRAEANVGATRTILRDLNAGMQSNPELGAMFDNPRLRGYLQALTPRVDQETGEVTHAGTLSWSDLQEFRTRVGDAMNEPRLAEKIAPRQLRALYGALSQDMEATARDHGENALRLWRRANNYYDGRMKRINDTLSLVVGERRDRTPNEAMAKLQSMLRSGSTDDAASFGRVMRSIPTEDARTVRATIINDQRGGRVFDPVELAKRWDQLSDRGKSALLPEVGLRDMMDNAATRAATATRDPLAGLSGEKAFQAFERMASSRGDSAGFRQAMHAMSPDEASAARALIIHRMGLATEGAQNAEGDAFSVARFLTRWNGMTPQSKLTLFGDAEMRGHMDDLARLAEKVKDSSRLAGHSNTGAINIADSTNKGLAAAALALLTGHPIIATGIATPIGLQRVGAQVLTSKRLLNWLGKAPKKPNVSAQRAHVRRLEAIAQAEPAIAGDIMQLHARLQSVFGADVPGRLAAEDRSGDQRQSSQRKNASTAGQNQ